MKDHRVARLDADGDGERAVGRGVEARLVTGGEPRSKVTGVPPVASSTPIWLGSGAPRAA
jgi:hypothetical protein